MLDWQEILVETSFEGIEAVADIASEIGAGGVAIEDPRIVKDKITEGAWDAYELPNYLTEGENALVRIYLPFAENLPVRVEDLKQRLNKLNNLYIPGCIKKVSFMTVKEEDWSESWKAFYKPLRIGKSFLIKPTWEEVAVQPDDVVIELDPGMAFGTGTHPTTILCLEYLEEIIRVGSKVYDVGTGTGILAIACAKLGAEVISIDIDEVAVKAAQENVAINGVADKVQVKLGNLLADEPESADVIIANIVAKVIRNVIPQAAKRLEIGGKLLVSGILNERLGEIYEWLKDSGFNQVSTRQSGDWAAVLAVREG